MKSFSRLEIRFLSSLLLVALFSSGCATAEYHSRLPEGLPKSADYPIPIYTEQQEVPRPCNVMGTVSVTPGNWTMFGGSLKSELEKVTRLAHEKGADAIKLSKPEKPDFTHPHFRVHADLLRYANAWEVVGVTKKEFERYLAANRASLDPIEGIWVSDGLLQHSIGIMRDNSRNGREFIGFILDSPNPVWTEGTKKMDIRRGPKPGSYVITYYLDDFERREIPVILQHQRAFTLTIWKANEAGMNIAYGKIEAH